MDENKKKNKINEVLDSVSEWLKKRKVLFETIGIFALTLMSISVSIASCKISNSQLALDKIQTDVLLAEQKPVFILYGIDKNNEGNKYSYVYADGHIYDAIVLMEDSIYITLKNENTNELRTVKFNISGRYVNAQTEYKNDDILFTISESNKYITPEEAVDKIINHFSGNSIFTVYEVLYSKDIMFFYDDYKATPCIDEYISINDNTYIDRYDDSWKQNHTFNYYIKYDINNDNFDEVIKNIEIALNKGQKR